MAKKIDLQYKALLNLKEENQPKIVFYKLPQKV